MTSPLIVWDGAALSLTPEIAGGIALVLLAALVLLVRGLVRNSRARAAEASSGALLAQEVEERIGELTRLHAEMTGRVQTMGEMIAGRQAELATAVGERLDAVTDRLGQSLESSARRTGDGLRVLHERLAVIDSAQKNLTELTSQVTSLREVLANKQARGAFGQARMEAIVRDGLPANAFAFQLTLSNGSRPDCGIYLPDGRPLIIDAKFPLEAVTLLRDAKSDDERRRAGTRIRQDVGRHVTDIASKYLIPGETQDTALMFVPSESVYADLHDGFDDIVQKAYRARIVLVSPSLLMLAIQVVQQIQRDSRMREAAGQIHAEVGNLLEDLRRMRERVLKLQGHFTQVNEDVRQILISSEKVEKRGTRITDVEFGEDDGRDSATIIPAPMARRLEAGE